MDIMRTRRSMKNIMRKIEEEWEMSICLRFDNIMGSIIIHIIMRSDIYSI